MLREKLEACPAKLVGQPTANDSKALATFADAAVHRASWNYAHSPALSHKFTSQLYALSQLKVNYRPQIQKLIESEGDVGQVTSA